MVNPTRMELTRLKKQLNTALRGHKLLKDKRDELMRRFLDLVRENESLRRQVEEGIRQADTHFLLASAVMSKEALDAALAISKELHENGTIRDGMTQKEIAWVYYKYLRSLHVKVGEGEEAVSTGKTALYDSVWACLVSKKADCVGRAAGFNLLMHIEGISAQGVRGRFLYVNSGHVLSRVILDGEEYFCDWGNDKGIWPEAEFAEKFNFAFDADSLAYARAHGGDYKA